MLAATVAYRRSLAELMDFNYNIQQYILFTWGSPQVLLSCSSAFGLPCAPDAGLLVQTSAGPGPSQGDTSREGDTSHEDDSVAVSKTAARPTYSRKFVVQSCMNLLNNRPPNSAAIVTVATGGDDSSEAEEGSDGDNGSDSADDSADDDDDASIETVN